MHCLLNMNQSKPEHFLDFLNHKIHLLAIVGLFINKNERFPYPFIYLKSKKGTPFQRSLPVQAIVRSTPPPPPVNLTVCKIEYKCLSLPWATSKKKYCTLCCELWKHLLWKNSTIYHKNNQQNISNLTDTFIHKYSVQTTFSKNKYPTEKNVFISCWN